MIASPALLEELADVLSRPFATQRLARIDKTSHEVLAYYARVVELIEPATVPRTVLGDIDDDQVIAITVAAQADFGRFRGSQAPIAAGVLSRDSHRGRGTGVQSPLFVFIEVYIVY